MNEAGDAFDLDPVALREKYLQERDKRLRKDGNAQYVGVPEHRPGMLDDPFAVGVIAREPIAEDVDVLIVGGGMTGVATGVRLRQAGFANIRILDRAADFGGTWYWNRYPGASCDTEAYIYMPLLDETGYVPTEKYARASELFGYFQLLGDRFGLYENACFQTAVNALRWNEETHRWIVTTDRGDEFRARFVCLCAGNLAVPKLPDIPGLDAFQGHAFHTCRWDYGYTGGDTANPRLTNLQDKRVAIIGTGCTAIQSVPHLAEWSKRLFVFQRTPSMVNVRANRPTDPDWAKTLTPGWQRERMLNFEAIMNNVPQDEDLVDDGWTSLAHQLGALPDEAQLPESISAAQFADFQVMEKIRRRVEQTVQDGRAREALKPYYNVHCKRPTFHDEYLTSFNRPNVSLVDTGGKGVERITGKGIIVGGVEYEVDCIIFSTGFEALTLTCRTGGYEIHGTGGQSLEDKWSRDFKTLHGIFTHGFPNLMVLGHVRDGGGSFNATFPFVQQATHAAEVMRRCFGQKVTRLEVTREAEDGWQQTMREKAMPLDEFLAECTPGYLNNEGKGGTESLRAALYGGGSLEYSQILDAWLQEGGLAADFEMSDLP